MAAATGLLVLDMQNDIMGFQPKETLPGVIGVIGQLVHAAREAGVPVIYTRVAFRPTYLDALPQLPALKQYRMLDETQPGSAIIDELAPQPSDVVVLKRRVSAFYNTDLDLVLRALGIGTLIYTGISTDRVVESTARAASDRDYRNIVVSDGCAAATPERHRAALDSIADFFGEVATSQAVLSRFS